MGDFCIWGWDAFTVQMFLQQMNAWIARHTLAAALEVCLLLFAGFAGAEKKKKNNLAVTKTQRSIDVLNHHGVPKGL